jgi:hypothetical protein
MDQQERCQCGATFKSKRASTVRRRRRQWSGYMPQPTARYWQQQPAPGSQYIRDSPACVLLNNQATDGLVTIFMKLAWPFGLGSCPKVDHDADDADRVPEGTQRIWSRAHGASGLDPEIALVQHFRFYAERQLPWLSQRFERQGVRQLICSNSGQKTPRK